MGLEGGLAGMIEGLFMLCGVRPAVWGESGGSRVLDQARLKNVASLRRSSSWEFIMSVLSAPAREQPDRGRQPRERARWSELRGRVGSLLYGFNLQSEGWENPAYSAGLSNHSFANECISALRCYSKRQLAAPATTYLSFDIHFECLLFSPRSTSAPNLKN